MLLSFCQSWGVLPMTGMDLAYLILVIAAMSAFAVVLAIETVRNKPE